jgi:hypothetical protein
VLPNVGPYIHDISRLRVNGWPEDRPKHVATPNSIFNIILELCLTDCSVDITIVTITQQDGPH